MRVHKLERKMFIPVSIQEAWTFFSSPYNLEKITPGYMKFRITSDLKNISMSEGMRIEYTVRPVANVPLKWITLISDVNAPYQFKDRQIKGPFKVWEHTHTFEEKDDGVEMTDVVQYALPLGFLGTIAHLIMVKKQLKGIFDYRRTVIEELFQKASYGKSN